MGPIKEGCEGNYTFQTPAAQSIIGQEMPPGAGAFVADYFDESDITWLDSQGNYIPPNPFGDWPYPYLPPEFFEYPPSLVNCPKDFEGNRHCPEDERNAAPVPSLGIGTSRSGGTQAARSSQKVVMSCPARLVLTGTLYKSDNFGSAVARYRFRWSHGSVSTPFSVKLTKEVTTVSHTVSLPLREPAGGASGGGSGPSSEPFGVTNEVLPANEHKSAVRLEVLNVEGGIVASPYSAYHIACKPRLNPGRGGGPQDLQVEPRQR